MMQVFSLQLLAVKSLVRDGNWYALCNSVDRTRPFQGEAT